jgi:hypothetical protein
MAIGMLASNYAAMAGKWLPYYFKPFILGRLATGASSTDGEVYITQTTGTSGEALYGTCTSDHNCGFYYTITFVNTLNFYVIKYDLNDNSIDTIYASGTSGDARYWHTLSGGGNDNETITIDIGVNIYIPDVDGFDNLDVYKITLPSAEVMRRRRIYHGGYSTFMRLPYSEDVSYHSSIIPTNLKGKNITMMMNPPTGVIPGVAPSAKGLMAQHSLADISGNNAVSVFLESSVKDAARHSAAAGSSTYGWASGEYWPLNNVLADDLDPVSSDTDFPALSQVPASDVSASNNNTGTLQIHQLTCSSKAGYVKLKLAYLDGTGGTTILAYNQFWPIILLIS